MSVNFRGHIDLVSGGLVRGWCASRSGEACDVTVSVNGVPRATFAALDYRKDLDQRGFCKIGGGFEIDISGFLAYGENAILFADPDRNVIPKGSFTLNYRDVVLGDARNLVKDASTMVVGVHGNPEFARNLGIGSALSKILNCLGVKAVANPDGSEEMNIWFCHPHKEKPQGLRHLINGRLSDISKSAIDRVHDRVFGRTVCVNLADAELDQQYVVKSEENAAHDGKIVVGQDLSDLDLNGSVIQRVIDNRIDDANVRDIRVVVIGREIPIIYLKTRPILNRFSNANRTAVVTTAMNVLSQIEIQKILRYCSIIGLDYGELDVLRDANSGDIWIVDVNNTPCGPPNGLSKAEVNVALREMSLSFYRQFLSPGLFFASEHDLRD